MEGQNIAERMRDLRIKKGLSQEQLSENAQVSIRTVQRIEKGESVPRGDTLVRLTKVLDVSIEDMTDDGLVENRAILSLMHLSAITIFFHPVLGVVCPLIIWSVKRGNVKSLEYAGKQLINFQITWLLVHYGLLLILSKGSLSFLEFKFSYLFYLSQDEQLSIYILLLLYLVNTVFVFLNAVRPDWAKQGKYWASIPILR